MGFRVLAIDSGDEKKEMCAKLGAEEFVDFIKEDVIASVKKHTGGLGAHAVILLAVSEKPFQQATEVRGVFFYNQNCLFPAFWRYLPEESSGNNVFQTVLSQPWHSRLRRTPCGG